MYTGSGLCYNKDVTKHTNNREYDMEIYDDGQEGTLYGHCELHDHDATEECINAECAPSTIVLTSQGCTACAHCVDFHNLTPVNHATGKALTGLHSSYIPF